jgi:hypothetical protein
MANPDIKRQLGIVDNPYRKDPEVAAFLPGENGGIKAVILGHLINGQLEIDKVGLAQSGLSAEDIKGDVNLLLGSNS